MNPTKQHKMRNLVQSALLIAGMAGLGALCTWMIWGDSAAGWMIVAFVALLIFSPGLSKGTILALYGARRLTAAEFPEGTALVERLSQQAELPQPPELYYVASALPNAFTVGRGGDAAIAISDGLLRVFNARELASVLAHEISHIANRDLWIMGLADVMARITTISSYVGMFLLILYLPMVIAGQATVPLAVPLILALSPTMMSLMQLALSRSREYNADLGAVRLTGDPHGLISALLKLERITGRFWEEIVFPGRRIPEPSLLRTHPPTEERVKRLSELAGGKGVMPGRGPPEWRAPSVPHVRIPPRWRRTGVWY